MSGRVLEKLDIRFVHEVSVSVFTQILFFRVSLFNYEVIVSETTMLVSVISVKQF